MWPLQRRGLAEQMLLVKLLLPGDHRSMGSCLRKNSLPFLLALLVMLAGSCWAFPYQIGDYNVDVTVRNSAMNLIPGIKVKLYRYDSSTVIVEAAATGYRTRVYHLPIRENQFHYKLDLTLEDPPRKVYVVDHNNQPIAAAYVRLEQFGFPADHFGITAFIPTKMWPQALASKVEVFDTSWGVPRKKSCEITQIEEFYCVKLSMTRKALKWSGPELLVTFKTSAPARVGVVEQRLARLQNISSAAGQVNNDEESLALYLAGNFSAETLCETNIAMPPCLAKLLHTRKRFAELHRENSQNF